MVLMIPWGSLMVKAKVNGVQPTPPARGEISTRGAPRETMLPLLLYDSLA
jgi:hypothetical protein